MALCLLAIGRGHRAKEASQTGRKSHLHPLLRQVSFHKTRDSLVSRPWVVDDLDAALEYFGHSSLRKAVMFCDNAGSDVILGVQPSPFLLLWSLESRSSRKRVCTQPVDQAQRVMFCDGLQKST